MRQLFVYYRLKPEAAATWPSLWHAYVQSLQPLLDAHGVSWEVLEREEPALQGERTLMEVFRHQEGISPALTEALRERAATLQPALSGPRHEEVFLPCAWSASPSTSTAGFRSS